MLRKEHWNNGFVFGKQEQLKEELVKKGIVCKSMLIHRTCASVGREE